MKAASFQRVLLLSLALLCGTAIAQPSQPTVSFKQDIAPILIAKCLTCHDAEKPKGKYQLHTFERLLKPGASEEKVVVSGKPEASNLYKLLIEKDPDNRMPQKDDALPASQIALFKRWIQEGARFDGGEASATLASIVPRTPHPEPPAQYPFAVPITALAFHPKTGELFASGYNEVTIWNADSGQLIRRLKDLPRQVRALAFSPDGTSLAVAGGTPGRNGELVIIDPASGKTKERLLTLSDLVLTAAYSPDGKMLAAAGTDNSIHLFHAATGRKLRTISQHADWISSIAFSPDGTRIASASRDRTARIFEVTSGSLEATYAGHDGYVNAVAFSTDGKSGFSGGRDKKIGLWKREDGGQIGAISGFDAEVLALVVVDDRLYAGGADQRVRAYKTSDRTQTATFEGHTDWVFTLAANAEGSRIASGAYNGEIRVWKLDGSVAASFTAAPGLVAGR